MIKKIAVLTFSVFMLISCSQPSEQQNSPKMKKHDWKVEVGKTLKQYGHRNWIVIADGAYPEQSNPAIKTITIDDSQLDAVAFVSDLIEKAKHVDANIFLDKEMAFVPEKDAEGIEEYRSKLAQVLKGKAVKTLEHEDIIRELDSSAKLFNVLIIKTDLAIPYTSVFFQLECGYWNGEAEMNIRKLMSEEAERK